MKLDSETYLGDGVYARFDGYQVWLRAPRVGGNHEIALDPAVYQALTDYVRKLLDQVKAARA